MCVQERGPWGAEGLAAGAAGAAGAGESNQGRGLEVSKKNPAESLLSMGEDGYDGSRYLFENLREY